MSFAAGDMVGDYRIVEEVGRGGMGRVFRVEHLITRRMEAMKILLEGQSRDPERAQRFLREIQTQARLHHPNIAQVYNAFTAGDDLVMVMEWVEGERLDEILAKGPLPLERALDYARQALAALSHAHAQGVTHRDVAPANLIVAPAGILKLTDFGLATGTAEGMRLTQSGTPVGSVYYMSPEQVRGLERPDHRTDLYSLGVVLYEMTTGTKPFVGDSAFQVMTAHVSGEPQPPSERVAGLPAALDPVILRALAKDPAERFASAEEFREALHRVEPTAPPRPARGWGWWAAAAVVWAVAAGLWIGRIERRRGSPAEVPPAPPPEAASPPEPKKPPEKRAAPAQSPALIPAPPPTPQRVTLSPGTVLKVRTELTLSANTHKPGEKFTARLAEPLVAQGRVVAPAGRLVEGEIAGSEGGGRLLGRSRLELRLYRLYVAEGRAIRIVTDTYEVEGRRSRTPLLRRGAAATLESGSVVEFRLAEGAVVE